MEARMHGAVLRPRPHQSRTQIRIYAAETRRQLPEQLGRFRRRVADRDQLPRAAESLLRRRQQIHQELRKTAQARFALKRIAHTGSLDLLQRAQQWPHRSFQIVSRSHVRAGLVHRFVKIVDSALHHTLNAAAHPRLVGQQQRVKIPVAALLYRHVGGTQIEPVFPEQRHEIVVPQHLREQHRRGRGNMFVLSRCLRRTQYCVDPHRLAAHLEPAHPVVIVEIVDTVAIDQRVQKVVRNRPDSLHHFFASLRRPFAPEIEQRPRRRFRARKVLVVSSVTPNLRGELLHHTRTHVKGLCRRSEFRVNRVPVHLVQVDSAVQVHLAANPLYLTGIFQILPLDPHEDPPDQTNLRENPRIRRAPVKFQTNSGRPLACGIMSGENARPVVYGAKSYRGAARENAEQIGPRARRRVIKLPVPPAVEDPWIPYRHAANVRVGVGITGWRRRIEAQIPDRILFRPFMGHVVDGPVRFAPVDKLSRVMPAIARLVRIQTRRDQKLIPQIHVRVFLDQNRRLSGLDPDGASVITRAAGNEHLVPAHQVRPRIGVIQLRDGLQRATFQESDGKSPRGHVAFGGVQQVVGHRAGSGARPDAVAVPDTLHGRQIGRAIASGDANTGEAVRKLVPGVRGLYFNAGRRSSRGTAFVKPPGLLAARRQICLHRDLLVPQQLKRNFSAIGSDHVALRRIDFRVQVEVDNLPRMRNAECLADPERLRLRQKSGAYAEREYEYSFHAANSLRAAAITSGKPNSGSSGILSPRAASAARVSATNRMTSVSLRPAISIFDDEPAASRTLRARSRMVVPLPLPIFSGLCTYGPMPTRSSASTTLSIHTKSISCSVPNRVIGIPRRVL